MSAVGHLFAGARVLWAIRRAFDREKKWAVYVRVRKDDPDGAVCHKEIFDRRDQARRRLDELEREFRAKANGEPPR